MQLRTLNRERAELVVEGWVRNAGRVPTPAEVSACTAWLLHKAGLVFPLAGCNPVALSSGGRSGSLRGVLQQAWPKRATQSCML